MNMNYLIEDLAKMLSKTSYWISQSPSSGKYFILLVFVLYKPCIPWILFHLIHYTDHSDNIDLLLV